MNIDISKNSRDETKLRLLLCGDVSRREFLSITESLRIMELNGNFEMVISYHPEVFFQDSQRNQKIYDIYVVLQNYIGQYTKAFYEHIRKMSPLAAMVIILGTLCEGEGRTGAPIVGGIRFYWHQWELFGIPQLKVYIKGKTGRFSLPVLALDENIPEVWPLECYNDDLVGRNYLKAKDNRIKSSVTTANQKVCVVAPEDVTMGKLLCDIYHKKRRDVIMSTFNELFERKSEWNRIIVDSVDLSRDDFYQKIRRLAHLYPLAQIDILAFSPRIEEVERFRQIPNCLIFSKPF